MGRSYPSQPIVGVGAIVLEGDTVLLVRRGRDPQKGLWSLPGGALELGETLHQGVAREMLEETGLEIRILEFVESFERITSDIAGRIEFHYVLLDYLCESLGGTLAAGDDAVEVAWVPRAELPRRQLTADTLPVIERAFDLRDKITANCP